LQTRREFVAAAGRRVSEYERRFREFVEELCRSGLAEEVYLVGSRARGDSTPSSDFDVVLVVDEGRDPVDVATRARLLRREAFPLDVVVLRRSEVGDPIYGEMLRDARRIC
jgi:predicted nucleotidyltransferase